MNTVRIATGWFWIWVGAVAVVQGGEDPGSRGPLSPRQSLRHMVHHPEVRVELAACEPQVVDPISIRFDEWGRMWVVQMRDYPLGPPPGTPPLSSIRVLEDRDQDGFYETARTFVQNIPFPTGVQPWDQGVFVTYSGTLAWMADTNGDGRQDVQVVWFRGFAQQNSQLRANHPRFALDNYVYVANGLRGGKVQGVKVPGEFDLRGMDFRFDPRSGRGERATGLAQFGLTFDRWGRRFICSNRNPLMHVVIPARYVARAPGVRITLLRHDVAASGFQSRVFPLTRQWTTSNLHAGQFTAACGVEIFAADLLPASMHGNAFVCEPTGNLVHREVLRPLGATFRSQPGRKGKEFLASRDPWFRPVECLTGPDGALYVVDMYRAVIEHPDFMPSELRKHARTRLGDDRGRIWRLLAKGAKRPRIDRWPGQMSNPELVPLLAHPNRWWRITAQRLLVQRHAQEVAPALRQLAQSGPPVAQVHALWTLHALGKLEPELILQALQSRTAAVVENGLILAEQFLHQRLPLSDTLRHQLLAQMLQLARHADPRVRFQVALSLTGIEAPGKLEALAQVALQGSGDVWMLRGVRLSVGDAQAGGLLALVLDKTTSDLARKATWLEFLKQLARTAPAGEPKWLPEVLSRLKQQVLARPALGRAVLASLFQGGLTRRLPQLPPSCREVVQSMLSQARQDAQSLRDSSAQPTPATLNAVELLGYDDPQKSEPLLTQLALESAQQSVRLAALNALRRQGSLESWQKVLKQFRQQTPAVRQAILQGVFARRERIELLLDQVASGQIRLSELDASWVNRLLRYPQTEIRHRARQLLAAAVPEDRQKAFERYRAALKLNANPRRGKKLFEKHCSACHRIAGIGTQVGPDISDTRVKTPLQLLTDIVQPNRAIDANYISYTAITTDGRVLTGIIVEETPQAITLQQQGGKKITLLRSELEQLASNGVSLMPEGLERNMSLQDMADLISFLKHWRYLGTQIPGVPDFLGSEKSSSDKKRAKP